MTGGRTIFLIQNFSSGIWYHWVYLSLLFKFCESLIQETNLKYYTYLLIFDNAEKEINYISLRELVEN